MTLTQKKVLIINTSGLGVGGITAHMVNYIGALKKEKYDANFTIIVSQQRDEQVLKKLSSLGCDLVYFPDRKKELAKYTLSLIKLIRKSDFDVLHVHGNSSTMGIELMIGKIYKIPVRVAHSHNSKCEHKILHNLFSPLLRVSYTQAIACSKLAGDWIFGKNHFLILENAIELSKFKFNLDIRNKYRKKLNIDNDTLLIGHVGNFNEQKNQDFLIKVFYDIQKTCKSKLVLIGEGPRLEYIKELVDELEIGDDVYFLGLRNDVNYWMQAMDVFVFPSKWEGFGMVLIEAQVSNLPIVASTEVPKVVKLTDKVCFVNLDDGISGWTEKILDVDVSIDRNFEYDGRLTQYDLSNNVYKIIDMYDNCDIERCIR